MKTIPLRITCAALAGSIALLLPAAAHEPFTMETVTVAGKAADLLGLADSATTGVANAAEIQARPYLRRGEILETVPGLILTQHAGGGKANQYFLRGFNLDHGTDFAISIEGMPVNMRTHAHGQGYADLNILIPELVERLDYTKGVYAAKNGDLSSAGSADFKLFNELPHGIASLTWGENNYWRGLLAETFNVGEKGKLTLALEYNYYDGPWVLPEEFSRWNGFARYFQGDADNHVAVTFMGYHADWQSSDQIPQRAIGDGRIARFGFVDPTTGGESQRYSLQLNFRRTLDGAPLPVTPGKTDGKSAIEAPAVAPGGDNVWRGNVYGFYYDLDLYSNFTYFLDEPERGDQFQQAEERWVFGGEVAREWNNRQLFNAPSSFVIGVQTRHDFIDPIGLYKTSQRDRFATVRQDKVYEGSIGIFAEATTRWTPWLRTTVGMRADGFWFDTESNDARNSGDDTAGLISPKLAVVLGPWAKTEFYLNAGTGFHSNDARGVNTTVDPISGDPVQTVDPLVRTFGAEVGVRTQIIPKLTLTAALWWLDSDSELVYVGDAGTNEPGASSRRYGVEVAAYWRPVEWFTLDAEFAATHARFQDVEDDYIPSSVPWMFSGGVTLGKETGPFGSLRARAFEKRPLIEDNSVQGKQSFLVNGQIGWRQRHWEVALECLNLFDREDNDIEYFYTSRLQGEAGEGVDDIHLHPTEPRTFRVRATYRF